MNYSTADTDASLSTRRIDRRYGNTPPNKKADRNKKILDYWDKGFTVRQIAGRVGITPARVSQIIIAVRGPSKRGRTPVDHSQVFDFLISYKKNHDGNTPTRREIANYLGTSSKSTAQSALHALAREGKIRIRENGQVEIVGGCWLPPDCDLGE